MDTDAENAVLITVDSLRVDVTGPYAEERQTPTLDRLADRGAVFEHAFATGNWTPFSFPGLLASRPVFADSGGIGVSDSPTLASALADAGITTGGFNAANGFLTSHWGYDDGFGSFESFVTDPGSTLYSRYLAAHPTVEAWLQLASSPFRRFAARLRGGSDERPFMDASRMLDVENHARSFIEAAESPFFLWIHYMDAHTPYVPAPRYIRAVSSSRVGTHRMLLAHARTGLGRTVGERTLADLRTLYQGAVRQIDASIGRVLDALGDAGIDDETAVIVAGDHGEEFQDHGHLAHYPKLYDELVRVPLIVDVPNASARRVAGQVGLDAVPPTICDLLDVPSPAGWTGESLAGTVADGAAPVDEPVISVTVRDEDVTRQPIPRGLDDGDLLVSARTDDWTYIENTAAGKGELYHRPSDPGQHDDLVDASDSAGSEALDRLRPAVHDHAASLESATGAGAHANGGPEGEGGEEGGVDTAVEARLEALGYR